MKTDYQFLIGQDFSVGDDVYTIQDVAWTDDTALVEANVKEQVGNDSPSSFPVSQVLQWLLVEEEIELFNPNFLGIAGS
ncbi:MAG: hypothetical protein O7B25_09440 [Gammaproteobacteria bacterium]|nr:hypothetical protein [Gammaproteobacteria bacterium]